MVLVIGFRKKVWRTEGKEVEMIFGVEGGREGDKCIVEDILVVGM